MRPAIPGQSLLSVEVVYPSGYSYVDLRHFESDKGAGSSGDSLRGGG